jgi:O-antigen ligase
VPQLVRGDPLIGHFPHVHNLYLQLLVDFGLVGLLLYCCVLAVLCRALLGDNARVRLGPDLCLFAGGSLALFLLVNLTQIRIDDGHSMYYVTLLYALVLSGAVAGQGTGRECSSRSGDSHVF